jgi:hypothetical protein
MATQRPAFAKRDREMKLKDKARAKAERREARRAAPRSGKGPPIEADEPAGEATATAEGTESADVDAGDAGVSSPVGSVPPGSPPGRPQ